MAKRLLTIGTMQLNEICETFSHELGISQDDALVLLKSLLADKEVTVDLSRPIVLSGMIEIMEIKIDGNSRQHAAS